MLRKDRRGSFERHGRSVQSRKAIFEQLAQMTESHRALPHERVHCRREDHRLGEIPRPVDTREEVVGNAHRELRQRVGVERCDDHEVGPLAELDV